MAQELGDLLVFLSPVHGVCSILRKCLHSYRMSVAILVSIPLNMSMLRERHLLGHSEAGRPLASSEGPLPTLLVSSQPPRDCRGAVGVLDSHLTSVSCGGCWWHRQWPCATLNSFLISSYYHGIAQKDWLWSCMGHSWIL